MSIAAIALCIAGCKEKEPEPQPIDDITEDGFYVLGEATGIDKVSNLLSMAPGINEADNQSLRAGMYEKYIVLQGGKEFTLAYVKGGEQIAYGATLTEFKADLSDAAYSDNPADAVFKGKMETGASAPKMKVDKTGLYHIVLDVNEDNFLSEPQIVLCPVTMGVRGGMNSWGFTELQATEPKNDGITYTITGQELAAGGKFKFAYNNAWKITLGQSADGTKFVKANTNLGNHCTPGGADIEVTQGAGKYKITLTYKLAAGEIANSFRYEIEQESKSEAPTTMYMIGNQFGEWKWESDGVVELVPVWGTMGEFWCTRYFKAADGFKFCATKAWNGDFTGDGSVGYTVSDGNCFVAEDGFYTVYVNGNNSTVEVSPAEVYGIGDAWGSNAWDFDAQDPVKFVADGDKMVATTNFASSALRLATKVQPSGADRWFDWWKTEYIFFEDGIIQYRGLGDDQARFSCNAGQKVVLDFNAGTGALEGEGQSAPDYYSLIGCHAYDNSNPWGWTTNFDSVPVEGQTGWWVVKNIGAFNGQIDFKFRKGTDWGSQIAAVNPQDKELNVLFPLRATDETGEPKNIILKGEDVYDVYLNPDQMVAFILVADTPFAVPTKTEVAVEIPYSIIGYHALDNDPWGWSTNVDMNPVDGFADWTMATLGAFNGKIDIKFRQGADWATQIGGLNALENREMNVLIPLKAKLGGPDPANLTMACEGNIDVYLNTKDMYCVFLPSGTAFAVPTEKEAGGAVSITIDGNFDDWADVPSAEASDSFIAFKVFNDADNFYFYVESDPGSRLWSGGAYLYLYFNYKNDLTQGEYSGTTGMGDHKYDAYLFMYLFGGSADAPKILDNPNGGDGKGMSLDNIVIAGNQPATSSDIVKMEIVIPRANFATQVNAGDVIEVDSYRSKDGGNVYFPSYVVK